MDSELKIIRAKTLTKAEEVFINDERLTSAVAVFHENDLITGVTLKTFSRFKKEKIEKELKKKLEEALSRLGCYCFSGQ